MVRRQPSVIGPDTPVPNTVVLRSDRVISRERGWVVPIAIYVNRKTGEYLRDPAVNARIIAAFREGGADAWFTADHQALLGPNHDAADYEVVTDILDVWLDRKSVVEGKSVSVRVDLGGRRIIKKKKREENVVINQINR